MSNVISQIISEMNRINPVHGITIIQEAGAALFLIEGGDRWVEIRSLRRALSALNLIDTLNDDLFDIADVLADA